MDIPCLASDQGNKTDYYLDVRFKTIRISGVLLRDSVLKYTTSMKGIAELDGILGMNSFLDYKSMKIDYPNKEIIFNSRIESINDNALFVTDGGFFCINVIIDGVKMSGIIDTGASIVVVIKPGFVPSDYTVSNGHIDTFSGTKTVKQINFISKSIGFSDIIYNDVPCISIDDKNAALYNANIGVDVLLGASLFQNNVLFFNFEKHSFSVLK